MNRLTHADSSMRMPQDAPPLSEEEIELIGEWIDQGAKWEAHWDYIPPDTSIRPPEPSFDSIASNGIDNFIFGQLEELGLQPSPKADKELPLRRVNIYLTGLPPERKSD